MLAGAIRSATYELTDVDQKKPLGQIRDDHLCPTATLLVRSALKFPRVSMCRPPIQTKFLTFIGRA